ncbi:MAG: hypothetical protein AB2L09_05365 [Coriobacteriia bacterium]
MAGPKSTVEPIASDSAAQAEIERLRQENARLAEELSGKKEKRSHRSRHFGAVILIIIGSLLLALSVPAVWINRTIMNTDNWVATVAPLAEDPAIQNAVAVSVSDAIIEAADPEARVEQYLPDQLKPLTVPIANAFEGFIRAQAATFTQSDLFAQAWVKTNTVAHKALVTLLTERTEGVLRNQNGVVAIDLGTLADEIRAKLEADRPELAQLLPSDTANAQIVLFSSPVLAQAIVYVDMLQKLAFWLPIVALLVLLGALALEPDRRRGVLLIGSGALAATILPLQALYLAKMPLLGQVQQYGPSQEAAASAAYDIILRNLFAAERLLALVALLLIIGAILAGPAHFAVAIRKAFSGGISSLGGHFHFGRFGKFVSAHRGALRLAGGIVAVLAVVIPTQSAKSIGYVIGLVVFLLVWLALIQLFGSGQERAEEAPSAPPHSSS